MERTKWRSQRTKGEGNEGKERDGIGGSDGDLSVGGVCPGGGTAEDRCDLVGDRPGVVPRSARGEDPRDARRGDEQGGRRDGQAGPVDHQGCLLYTSPSPRD